MLCSGRSGHFRNLQGVNGFSRHRDRSAPHIFWQQHFLTCVDSTDDTTSDIEVLANKMYINTPFDTISTPLYSRGYVQPSLQIRVFDDPTTGSMWKQSVKGINGEVLCVSQFTLLADTRKGNKPDFRRAMVNSLCCFQLPPTRLTSPNLAGLGKIKGDVRPFLGTHGQAL